MPPPIMPDSWVPVPGVRVPEVPLPEALVSELLAPELPLPERPPTGGVAMPRQLKEYQMFDKSLLEELKSRGGKKVE